MDVCWLYFVQGEYIVSSLCNYKCGVFSRKYFSPLIYEPFQGMERNGNYLDKNKMEASWSAG